MQKWFPGRTLIYSATYGHSAIHDQKWSFSPLKIDHISGQQSLNLLKGTPSKVLGRWIFHADGRLLPGTAQSRFEDTRTLASCPCCNKTASRGQPTRQLCVLTWFNFVYTRCLLQIVISPKAKSIRRSSSKPYANKTWQSSSWRPRQQWGCCLGKMVNTNRCFSISAKSCSLYPSQYNTIQYKLYWHSLKRAFQWQLSKKYKNTIKYNKIDVR